ncbi:MAG: DMT family transporter [Chloroflexi bacterium]|nr:DMT family transporter [Chloroflexota bacterium]
MDWVEISVLSAAIVAAANVLESHILSRRIPTHRVYLLLAALISLSYATIIITVFPFPEGIRLEGVFGAIFSGLVRSSGVAVLFYVMKKEDVSRIVPVVFTYPVFVALLAAPFLGESLSPLQWLAILVVVAGAVMVSAKKSPSGSTTWPGRVFFVLLGVSFLFALADLAGKYAVGYISAWNVFAINTFLFALVFGVISARPAVLSDLARTKQPALTVTMAFIAESLAVVAIGLLIWAMERGPVSLVSTIVGSRPIFVSSIALVVSHLAPSFLIWTPGRRALRFAATMLIFAGISIIYLS